MSLLGAATHTVPPPFLYPGTGVFWKQVWVPPPVSFPMALVTLVIGIEPQTLSSTANSYSAVCISSWHKRTP